MPDPEVSHGRGRLVIVAGILSAIVVAAALVLGVRALSARPARADGSGQAGVSVRGEVMMACPFVSQRFLNQDEVRRLSHGHDLTG